MITQLILRGLNLNDLIRSPKIETAQSHPNLFTETFQFK